MALLVFISKDAAVAAAAAAHIGGHQIGAQKRRQRVGAAHRAHLRAALKEQRAQPLAQQAVLELPAGVLAEAVALEDGVQRAQLDDVVAPPGEVQILGVLFLRQLHQRGGGLQPLVEAAVARVGDAHRPHAVVVQHVRQHQKLLRAGDDRGQQVGVLVDAAHGVAQAVVEGAAVELVPAEVLEALVAEGADQKGQAHVVHIVAEGAQARVIGAGGGGAADGEYGYLNGE